MQNTRCNLKSCLAFTDMNEFPLALRVEQAPKSPLLKHEFSAYVSQVEKKIVPPASFLLPSTPREKGGQVQTHADDGCQLGFVIPADGLIIQ